MSETENGLGPHVRALIKAMERGPARAAGVPSLDALLVAPVPAEVRAVLETWNAHVVVDLRVGGLHFDDAFLSEAPPHEGLTRPSHKIVVIGQRTTRREGPTLAISGLDSATLPASFTLRDGDTHSSRPFDEFLRAKGLNVDEVVGAIRDGAPRATPSPKVARVLASALPADLHALFVSWQEHELDSLSIGGITLGDDYLHEASGRARHGHGYDAELGEVIPWVGAMNFGISSSFGTDWIGFREGARGVAADILFETDTSRSMTGKLLEDLLREHHQTAQANGRRYKYPIGRSDLVW